MKCDELKVHKAYNRWTDEEMPTPNDDLIFNEVYLKYEVDAAIDELKTENESLLQQNRELCQALQVMYSKEEYDKQKAQFVPLYEELKRVKDENENLKNNLFVVETDIAMSQRWRKCS